MDNKPTYAELEQKIKTLEKESFEHKRAEEERELTVSLLRSTLEATVDGIIVVGLDSETKVFSKRFKKIWHMPDSVLDSEDANQVLDYVLDQINEPEVFSQKVQAVFADPNSNTFDTLHLKDGRILGVYSRPQKLEDKMIGRVWAFRDQTKPKQAIMERQKAQSRLQALSDASFEAIFFSDQGVCIDQNSAAERMFGYSHKEAIGRNGTEWIVPEDREKVKNNMLAGYEKPYEVTGLRKDGSTFPAEIQGHMFNFMGKPTRVTALRDNSVQQQAREALRESEERLDMALSGANLGVWDWYPDNNTIHFDTSYYTIAGYEPNDFPCTFEEWEKRVHPDDIQQTKLAIEQYMAGDREVFEVEFRFLRKDGAYMWIYGKGKIVSRDEKGNPKRFVGIHLDITERKQAEETLQEGEERQRSLIEAVSRAGILLFVVDNEYKVRYMNEPMIAGFGDATGRICYLEVGGLDSPCEYCQVSKVIGDGERVHYQPTVADGRTFDIIAVPYTDIDGTRCKLEIIQDVTSQMQAQEALRESEEKYRSLITNIPDATWTTDSGTHSRAKKPLKSKI